MITPYAERFLNPSIRRGGYGLPPIRPWWTVFLGILALSATLSARPPQAAPRDCGTGQAGRCAFENAPPRILAGTVRIPGKPHLYSELAAPLGFTDAGGTVWTAPRATLTDGASIPPVFVPLIGAPRSPEFLAAATLHDAYCGAGNEGLVQYRARSWEDTHRMFYDSLRAAGVSAMKGKVMFAAVYLGGPRWDDAARALDGVPDEVLRAEMERCIDFITAEDPEPEEIVAWMRRREAALQATAQPVH